MRKEADDRDYKFMAVFGVGIEQWDGTWAHAQALAKAVLDRHPDTDEAMDDQLD